MLSHAKVCPRCRTEYLPRATQCADCGSALVWEGEAGAEAEPAPMEGLAGALQEEGVLLRECGARWAGALADALTEAGIPCRVGPTPAFEQGRAQGQPVTSLPLGVFVREQDLTAARRVDVEHLRAEVPELRDAQAVGSGDALEAGEGCPACGAAVASDAPECPECGLGFVA